MTRLKFTRTSARPIAAAAILFLLSAAACLAQIEPLVIKPAVPVKFEDKLAAAQVVMLGTIDTVSEIKDAKKSAGRKSRRNFAATVKIEKVYKGNPGEGKLNLIFVRSDNDTTPRLLDFSPGERVVLFLRSSDTAGYLETISPFSGKERPDSALLKKLEAESTAKGLTGGVAASLKLLTAAPAPGGPVLVEFRMDNTGSQPMLFGSTPSPAADLAISGPSGNTVYPSPDARDPKAISTPLLLKAGAYHGYTADISAIFNLSAPGKYTVTAVFKPGPSREASSFSGSVSTNSVTFEIPKRK